MALLYVHLPNYTIAVAPATLAVGNGGVLKTARFGRAIDSHTAVFRANQVRRCRLTPG